MTTGQERVEAVWADSGRLGGQAAMDRPVAPVRRGRDELARELP